MSEEVMTPETVCRSPHSFEIVEPTKGTTGRPKKDLARDIDPCQEAADLDPLRLHSSEFNHANIDIVHEKPEHRIIIYLKAQGMSNREVAEQSGYTEAWISQVCRQPWFRLRLVQVLQEMGVDKVQALLKSAALDSVYTIIELRDDTEAPKAVRRAAADSLLDRWLGKPTVHVSRDEPRMPSTPEVEEIDRELAQIENQLKETNGQTEV